jgi:hypothetical protein
MSRKPPRRLTHKRVSIQRDDLTTFGRTIDDEVPATFWRAPEWQVLLKQTQELADRWGTHGGKLLSSGNRAGGNRAHAIAGVLAAVERAAGPHYRSRAELTEAHIEMLRDPRWSSLPPADVQAKIAATHDAEDDWLLEALESSRSRKIAGPPPNIYDDAAAIEWFKNEIRAGLSNNPTTNAGGWVWSDAKTLTRLCWHALDSTHGLARWVGPAMADADGFWAADRRRVAAELADPNLMPVKRDQFLALHPQYRDMDEQRIDPRPPPLTRLEDVLKQKIAKEWEQAGAVALKSPDELAREIETRITDLTRETLAAFDVSREDISKHLLRAP